MINFLLLVLFGYLLGSVPSGYLISKFKGVDIRKVGSGNIGGTNVSRAFGLKWGVIVGLIDVLKGTIPAYLALRFLDNGWQIILVMLAPVLGNIFNIWLGFKGGKGVATTAGVLLMFLSQKHILILLSIWILVLLVIRIMSIASLSMAFFIPFVLWDSFHSQPYALLGIALACLIWWSHRENIKRIMNKTEPRFKFKKSSDINK